MSYQGRFQNGKAKPSGGVWKTVLIVILCVVLILGALFAAGYFYLESKLHKVNQAQFVEKDVSDQDLAHLIGNLDETEPTTISTEPTTEPTTEATTEATTAPTEPDYGQSGKIVNILVVGQDSRGSGVESSKLADGIMLFTLNKETHTLSVTSFLRDSYVKLADYRSFVCGWNRINTAYALGYSRYGDVGAMEMLNETLEFNYGVKVDGNIEVSLPTAWDVIEAIGGIDVELDEDELAYLLNVQEYYNNLYTERNEPDRITDIQLGMNNLNGDLGMAYIRMRHATPGDSDMNRTARQRKAIASVLDKLTKMSPLELNSLIDFVLSEITTNISTEDMKMYIMELTPYLVGLKLESYQIPAEGTYWGEMVELPDGVGGVLKIDFPKNKQVIAAIQNGEEVPTFK